MNISIVNFPQQSDNNLDEGKRYQKMFDEGKKFQEVCKLTGKRPEEVQREINRLMHAVEKWVEENLTQLVDLIIIDNRIDSPLAVELYKQAPWTLNTKRSHDYLVNELKRRGFDWDRSLAAGRLVL